MLFLQKSETLIASCKVHNLLTTHPLLLGLLTTQVEKMLSSGCQISYFTCEIPRLTLKTWTLLT